MIDGELAVFQPNLPTKQSTALRCALCCYKVRNYCTLYPYAVRRTLLVSNGRLRKPVDGQQLPFRGSGCCRAHSRRRPRTPPPRKGSDVGHSEQTAHGELDIRLFSNQVCQPNKVRRCAVRYAAATTITRCATTVAVPVPVNRYRYRLFQTVASENQGTANNSHSGGPANGCCRAHSRRRPAPPLPPERATARPVWFLGDPNYRVL